MRLLSLLIVLAFLPTTQALWISGHPSEMVVDLVPDASREVAFDVTISCDLYQDGIQPTGRFLVHELHTEHPSLVASGQTRYPLPDNQCLQSEELVVPVNFTLVGSTDVPGERPLLVEHVFVVEDAEGNHLSESYLAMQQVVMAWYGKITATTETAVQMAGPQKQISYLITVTNHGNARTAIDWEIVGERPDQGRVVLPDQMILDSANNGGATTATATVTYSTPFDNGDNRVSENFTIRAIPHSTKDAGNTAQGVELELRADTKGVYVPGPAALLPAALLLAALVRRR